MNKLRLRAIIIKLQDRLTDDDRKRLHFFLGNDVPRRIRDDPSLGGTLGLMESLFDQDKINEEDFSFLINAFDEIQCIDAVKLLREHMRRIRSDGFDQSVQSLSLVMPVLLNDILEDQDDEFCMETRLIDQTSIYGDNNTIISHKNINNNPVTILVDGKTKSAPSLTEKKLLKTSKMSQKCLILFVLLTIILTGVVVGGSIWIFHLGRNYKTVINKQTKENENIQYLKDLQSKENKTITNLTKLLSKKEEKIDGLLEKVKLLEIDRVTIRYGSIYGSTGGGPFDDASDLNLSPMKPCIGVEVFWRSHLFAIRFIYEQDDDSTQKFYHGNHTYERETNHSLFNETFLLSKEDRIYKVTWHVGTGTQLWSYGGNTIHYVLGIQFYTTTGRISPFYGEKGGEEFTESYGGFTLGYAQGKSGSLVDSLRFVWYNQGPFGKTYDGVWVEAEEGKVPPDAVVGGLEDNRRVYVVRCKTRDGNMIPGRLVEGNQIAEYEYDGIWTSLSYQVLVNPDSKQKLKWVATNVDKKIPEGAFLAGKEEQINLYVGRVRVSSSLIHLGKYKVPHLYFTHEGKGKRLDDNIEVLCVS